MINEIVVILFLVILIGWFVYDSTKIYNENKQLKDIQIEHINLINNLQEQIVLYKQYTEMDR